ncbi:MAG: sugar ABC transporter substrate-binding protein [Ilumatobacter sp.]
MRRLVKGLAAPLAFAMVVAACGSDDGGDSATTDAPSADSVAESEEPEAAEDEGAADEGAEDEGAGGEGLARAEEIVAANLEIPTAIGPTIPLDGTPDTKTVAWLECSLPSCIAIGVGFQEAMETIGWNLEVISWSTDAAAAFQQAIDLGVDYVALTGTAPALVQDQIDAAAEAGIAFFSCFDTADPMGEENNIWMQCGDEAGVEIAGNLLANAIIADSGGTANALMVNIPDFAGLQIEAEGAQAAYDAPCPDCTFDQLNLTLDQLLAGEAPGAVVAAIQNDPTIDYVHFAFDGLAGGMSSTLAEAELLDGRNLVGVDYNGPILQEIVDGTQQFWTTNPKAYSAWLMVDGMARHALGQENTEERSNAVLPSFLVNDAAVAEPLIPTDGWPGPSDMAAQFAALWGV